MFNKKDRYHNSRTEHVLSADTSFSVKEAYKYTSTSLLFSNLDDGCNVLAFTSASAGEGKTVTCVNIAISLAESGKKVLLIDSDMRKPQVAATLKISGTPGLSELLSGVVSIDDNEQLCRVKTAYPNLDVIPAGSIPPNPAELIAGHRTEKLFEKLTGQYDYIFIDTPPTMVVADALLYKKYTSGYVVVVRANISRRDTTVKLIDRFAQIDARVIGFILNDKKETRTSYKHYSSYSK